MVPVTVPSAKIRTVRANPALDLMSLIASAEQKTREFLAIIQQFSFQSLLRRLSGVVAPRHLAEAIRGVGAAGLRRWSCMVSWSCWSHLFCCSRSLLCERSRCHCRKRQSQNDKSLHGNFLECEPIASIKLFAGLLVQTRHSLILTRAFLFWAKFRKLGRIL